ncbi:MAG: hypothetical protein ACJ8G7_15565 [Rhizobacter sp.]
MPEDDSHKVPIDPSCDRCRRMHVAFICPTCELSIVWLIVAILAGVLAWRGGLMAAALWAAAASACLIRTVVVWKQHAHYPPGSESESGFAD